MADKEKPVIVALPPFSERHSENEPAFLFTKHTRRILEASRDNFELIYDLETNRRHGYTVMVGDTKLWFPLAIIRGAQPGPSMVITAGIEAGGSAAVKAALELSYELDFSRVHGTICIVPIADTSLFYPRDADAEAPSARPLSSSFPGNAAGSSEERVAAALWDLIQTADLYLDLHAGTARKDLYPHAFFCAEKESSALEAESAPSTRREDATTMHEGKLDALLRALDVPFLVESPEFHAGSAYACASRAGIPSAMLERGGSGRWSPECVAAIKGDVCAALQALGILEGSFTSHQATQTTLDDCRFEASLYSGVWQPMVEPGDPVDVGQLLGTVTDPFGNTLATLQARTPGVVLQMVSSLNLIKGEPAVVYAGR